MYDHKLKYRSLDQLVASVADDWPGYDTENLIDKSQLIKVVQKVNKQLGLRITTTKEKVLTFENWVANLPLDLENLNFAVICGEYTVNYELPQGVRTENVDVDCNTICGPVFMTPLGDTYKVIVRDPEQGTITFSILKRVKIISSQYQEEEGDITGKFVGQFLKLNIKSGNLYINYEGVLEDEDGKLLVLDHPMVNDYYEYSLKERILENMLFNGEDVERKLSYIIPKLQQSKREAYGVANLPEFQELETLNRVNREAMYARYYQVFIC